MKLWLITQLNNDLTSHVTLVVAAASRKAALTYGNNTAITIRHIGEAVTGMSEGIVSGRSF